MQLELNEAQTRALANFFFDIAKGIIIGGFGFTYVIPNELRFLSMIGSVIISIICVRLALKLLSVLS